MFFDTSSFFTASCTLDINGFFGRFIIEVGFGVITHLLFFAALFIISTYFVGISLLHLLTTNASIAFAIFPASDFGAYSLSFKASFDILAGENIYLPPTQSAAHFSILIGSPPVVNQPIVPPSQAPVTFTRENTCLQMSCACLSLIASPRADATS